MDVVRRPKDAFLIGSEFSSTNLDRAGHFGPVHGSNRQRSGKQLITLDLITLDSAGRAPKRRREEEEEGSEQRREVKSGVRSQSQPKW